MLFGPYLDVSTLLGPVYCCEPKIQHNPQVQTDSSSFAFACYFLMKFKDESLRHEENYARVG